MTAKKSVSESTDKQKLTDAHIEEMVRTNRWWPFDRVPEKILPRMHRSIVSENPMTDVEEALW